MMKQAFITAEKLAEEIRNIQKCLQCTICLHTISDPVKTLCGHRFCRQCIQTLLQSKNALCPLCNRAIQRRSISKDEHMILYIDGLQKLIEAVQSDSGIDILSYLSRPRCTQQSELSGNTEFTRCDTRQLIKPSCSYVGTSLQKEVVSRNRRGRSRKNLTSQKNRTRSTQKKDGGITKYLSKCGLSGIGQLDESNDSLDENLAQGKVTSWLENLSKQEALDSPYKSETVQSPTCNFNDTLIISVSQNDPQIKIDNFDKDVDTSVKDDPSQAVRQVGRTSLRSENNESDSNNTSDRRTSTETKTAIASSKLDFDTMNPRPSTSRMTRSFDDSKEKSEEKFIDVNRTSPCDMLSSMQKNWSSVEKFGKEMRTRKKKLKSLNVSIENKGKSRSVDEATTNLNKEENVKPKVVDDIGNGRTRKRKESMMAEDVANVIVDERFDEETKSSAKSDFVRARDASPPSGRKDRSMSEKVQSTTESSFITLEEDRQVRIRYLNTCQMNAIIGVTYEDSRDGIETDQTNNGGETMLPTKRHVDLFDTPFHDRDKIFSQTSLVKSDSYRGGPNLFDESRNEKNCSPTPTKMITMIDEADSTSNLQTSTPHRRRLSLKRTSTDFKLNNSPSPIVDSRIGLQTVKRDLRFEIERESDQADGNVGADKRSLEEAIGTQKRRASTGDKLDGKRVRGLTATSTEFTNRRLENSGCNMSLVTFTKLGKTFKRRRKRIPFLYLGTTKRKAMVGHYPGFHLQRPCNPVDILDTLDYTIQDGFGNNALITLNDTQIIDENEGKEAEPVAAVSSVTEAVVFNNQVDHREENPPQEIQKKIVSVVDIPDSAENKSPDIDVLLVSLSGNKKPYLLPCDEQFAKSNNTSSKDTVKMIPSANDSQLQFLSLESPPIDTLQTQKRIHGTEPNAETNKVSVSGGFLHMSDQSDSPRTPMRKRRRFDSQDKFSDRMKIKSKVSDEEDVCSNHSFSSEVTCIRNDNEEVPIFQIGLDENCQSSDPSSKDTEIVPVSSGSNIATNEKGNKKKVFKRILPIASSSTDSPDIVSQGVSPTTKRKRVVSPEVSDGEWTAIVHNWVDERCKKKGKLEQTRDSSNLTNASRAARDNASLKSGSSDRDKSTNKLSTQCRQQLDFAGRSSDEETNFNGTKWSKSLDKPKDSSIVVQDSPDFGLTIDRMKNIRNKTTELIQADTYDDIMANTDYEEIIIEDDNAKNKKSRRGSVECLEIASYERKSKSARSCVESSYSSSKDVLCVPSNGSDKENNHQISGVLYDSDNENEERLVPVYVNVVNKNSRKNRLQENSRKSSGNESMCISNKSLGQSSITSSSQKHPTNSCVSNSTIKDMSEHDSLMDITQHDLMIKQFEMDLFEKNYKNSNVPLEMEKKILQTPKRNKKCSNADGKDVEHSGEEDDIVENTPNTKTKNLEAINSTQRNVTSSFSVSKTLEKPLPAKILQSATGRCLTNISTPNSTISIPPLYQSTPKMHQSTCNNATKLVPRANESSNKQTKDSIQRNMDRSVEENAVQRTNNIEKDVVQIINNSQDNIVKSTNNVGDVEKNIAQRAHYANRQKLCFVCSGLTIHEIDLVKKLTQMLDGRYLAQFDKDVTHVIVKADKNNGASNTLKYLQGIVHRKWIVSYQWVVDSVKEKRLVNEEPYEVVDSKTLEEGPRKSRCREKGLFEGFCFLCIEPYVNVSIEQYQDLLRATGAIVVDSLRALAAEKNLMKIILIQADLHEFQIIVTPMFYEISIFHFYLLKQVPIEITTRNSKIPTTH
ncbi:breast cancer type 1 susceptibility protein homolog isoform X2 [Bombus pyrosoma]|uniref:breast cancer type 1 susceptibility protein homolog isoform X2 n=1 Tax=Bombus pyrosoma TaxID=396416 RepID=UPI001CB9A95D|nr:breast cancer type 1 susceptibility protein homolog isoform X2 [Bombus pyrosoma]